ncbi:LemA family protein [Tissierella sp. MSJ-40]|uniref:LemA family protein n=1 Tax=Tissierella simiarum TaxID=2841534 RepID=A0ABS6EBA5_9FIRM|nr:LemA family protein [Tissierella simiarum]MBU5440067.1 LemA family protein [Tissierella simiarum]
MKGKFIVILGVVVLLVALFAGTYNKLAVLDENVDSAWAQVENVLKRRADLIPNLVNTVKGYASHEKEVLVGITEARSRFTEAKTPEEYAQANEGLNTALTKLYAVVENYPELKANQNFTELQFELSGTENRIATERMRYNDSVKAFNTTIRRFPTNVMAKVLGFEKRQYFEINQKDAEVPEVNF